MQLLAVADDDAELQIFCITSPAMFGHSLWKAQKIAAFDSGASGQENGQLASEDTFENDWNRPGSSRFSLFQDSMESVNSISSVIFSPWMSSVGESETVISLCARGSIEHVRLFYRHGPVSDDPLTAGHFRIERAIEATLSGAEKFPGPGCSLIWQYIKVRL